MYLHSYFRQFLFLGIMYGNVYTQVFFAEINVFIFLRWNAFKPPQATQLQTLTKAQKIKER